MKRSQTITLLALGISLSACSDSNTNTNDINHCDRSNSNYDQQQCDQQIENQQHSYHHSGYTYYPWFRSNYHNAYTPRLSYGWNHGGGTAFVPVPVTSYAPPIGAARTAAISSAARAVTSVSSTARGGFGSIGAGHASGGGE